MGARSIVNLVWEGITVSVKPPEENIVDYAMPMMKIEKLMRAIHDLCLKNSYGEAADLTPHLIAEARILQASLALMEANRK